MPFALLLNYAPNIAFKQQQWMPWRSFLQYTFNTEYMPKTDKDGHFAVELPHVDPKTFHLFQDWAIATEKNLEFSSQYMFSSAAIVPRLEDLQSDVIQLCHLAIMAEQLSIDHEFVENVVHEFKELFAIAKKNNLRTPVTQDSLLLLHSQPEDYATSEAWTLLNVELSEAFTANTKEQRVAYDDYKKLFSFPSFREVHWENVLVRFHEMAQELSMVSDTLDRFRGKEKSQWLKDNYSVQDSSEGSYNGRLLDNKACSPSSD